MGGCEGGRCVGAWRPLGLSEGVCRGERCVCEGVQPEQV